MGSADLPPKWSIATRVLFRFVFMYLAVYNLVALQNFINIIPKGSDVSTFLVKMWDAVLPWVGEHVFGKEIAYKMTGSGDTLYDYVRVFCIAVFAAAMALVWSLVDRKRPNYRRLHEWLRVYTRYTLGLTMIVYGAAKVIKAQFPSPSLDRLLQPFGDASPMGLLWTFMGASESYNIFSGLGELIGGLLVTVRRTTLLGALVCIGVMSNVVMLNFSYDVPVKLLSTHLLAMAVFLCLPDMRRLANLFVLNRPADPSGARPVFREWKWLNRGAAVLGGLVAVTFTGLALHMAYDARMKYGDWAEKSPHYGIWNVEEFTLDGQARPEVMTDESRWRRVVFDHPEMVAIQLMTDARQRYGLKLDGNKQTLELSRRDKPDFKATFTYQQPEPELLTVDGSLDGHAIRARLRKQDVSKFQLTSRGFNWISEYPYNR
jgi:hypothetical protein